MRVRGRERSGRKSSAGQRDSARAAGNWPQPGADHQTCRCRLAVDLSAARRVSSAARPSRSALTPSPLARSVSLALAQPAPTMSRLPTDDPDSDLDDLDDLLPSFSAPGPSALPSSSSAAPPPALAASHRPPAAPAAADEDDDNDEAFATELAANMERMLADLSAPSPPLPSSASTSPAAGRRAPAPPADEGASWEAAFAQALAGELGPAPSGATATAAGAASGAGTGPTPPGGLKDTVRETMERLRASAEQSDGAVRPLSLSLLLLLLLLCRPLSLLNRCSIARALLTPPSPVPPPDASGPR